MDAKGWRAIERDGLTGLYEVYAAQVALYQAYLDCTNPALFTVSTPTPASGLNFLVPFDAQLAQDHQRPRRDGDRGHARRRAVAARHRRSGGLALPDVFSHRNGAGGSHER